MVVSDPQSKAEAPRGAVRKRRSSGVVVPHEPYWYQRLGAWAVFLLVRVVSATLRYQWTDRSGYFEDGPAGPAIYCVWHNRLALCLIEYYGYVKKHNQTPGMAALVSASKDGGFLAGVLGCFKVQPAWPAGSAGTHWLGGARLRSGHHPRRTARTALRGAGRHHGAGAGHRPPDHPGLTPSELEGPGQELGPVSNPPPVLAV